MNLKSDIVHKDFWREETPKIEVKSIRSFTCSLPPHGSSLHRPNEFFGFCGIAWLTAIFLVIGSLSQDGVKRQGREGKINPIREQREGN